MLCLKLPDKIINDFNNIIYYYNLPYINIIKTLNTFFIFKLNNENIRFKISLKFNLKLLLTLKSVIINYVKYTYNKVNANN